MTGTSGTGTYTLNTRNQVTSATDGGLYVVKGRAPTPSTPTITVDAVSQTVTKGTYGTNDYFKADVSGSGPDYEEIVVTSGGDSGTWYKAVPPATDSRTYDYSGNLLTDWRWTYTWDAYDRLIKMVTKSTAVSAGVPNLTLDFVYDHMGRRVRKTVKIGTTTVQNTKFVYNGWNLVAELNAMTSDSLVRSYLWGTDLSGTLQGAGGVGGLLAIRQKEGTVTDQLVCIDGNGNIMALVDAAVSGVAAIKARYTYDAFGQKNRAYGVFAATNPFGFSSKYEDSETGLLYYGYRFYDPAGGRWLSRDPIGEEGGLNLYGFVGNNGVSKTDFNGLIDWSKLWEEIGEQGHPGQPGGNRNARPHAQRVADRKRLTVDIFKSVYKHYLPKKLIEHYAYSAGQNLTLTEQETLDCNIWVGLGRSEEFEALLRKTTAGKDVAFKGKGWAGAYTNGTLGNLEAHYNGTLCVTKTSWNFTGTVTFTDKWDFDKRKDRNFPAETKTFIGRNFLPGTPFKIDTPSFNMTQTKGEQEAKWKGAPAQYIPSEQRDARDTNS